jgi:hypothetical protein
MKISPTLNHGKIRWRINIQANGYRRRLFFDSREKALAFVRAASRPVTIADVPLSGKSPVPAPRSQ